MTPKDRPAHEASGASYSLPRYRVRHQPESARLTTQATLPRVLYKCCCMPHGFTVSTLFPAPHLFYSHMSGRQWGCHEFSRRNLTVPFTALLVSVAADACGSCTTYLVSPSGGNTDQCSTNLTQIACDVVNDLGRSSTHLVPRTLPLCLKGQYKINILFPSIYHSF